MIKTRNKKKNVTKILGLVSVSIVVTLLFVAMVYFQQFSETRKNQNEKQEKQTVVTKVADNSIEETNQIVPEKVFLSKELGITFRYPTLSDAYYREPVEVKQSGNKVNLTNQFVEVFSKDPKDDLLTAIRKSVLKNYSSKNCILKYVETPVSGMSKDFKYAVITLPPDPKGELYWDYSVANECPNEPYTVTNFVATYAYDARYPEKFLFFNLGQDGLALLRDGKSWQDTVEFFR